MSTAVFPTFCHISEFGDRAYNRLDTMISLSFPLTLWAPSWNFIEAHANEQVSASVVCKLVEKGLIRIAGREFWINNRKRRQERAKEWEGAQWTTYDERIQSIAVEDQDTRPEQARRVQIVADEDGYPRADEFLSNRPEAIESISRLIRNKKIPQGTQERIEREGLTGFQAAREVLRDARNHGRAIGDTGARVPFLSLDYGRFVGLINEIDEPLVITTSERRVRSIRELAQKTLDLLDDLASFGQPNLSTFAGSSAHYELASWMAEITEVVKDKNVSDIEQLVLESLRRDIDKNFPEIPTFDIREVHEKLENQEMTEVLSRIFELLACAVHPGDLWHLGGAIFVSLRFGYNLLISFNFVPADYAGMNWLFLYVFGRRPRLRDLELFRHYLEIRLKGLGWSKALP